MATYRPVPSTPIMRMACRSTAAVQSNARAVDDMWTQHSVLWTRRAFSTESHLRNFPAVRAGGNRCGQQIGTYAGANAGCAQSTAPITAISSIHHLMLRRGTL